MKKKTKMLSLLIASVTLFSINQPSFISAEEEVKVTTEDGSKIGFGIPKLQSQYKSLSLASTENTLETNSIIINENTIEQTITIDTENSISIIEIPLDFSHGEYIVLGKDEQGNADGAALIFNKENESIGIISSPIIENEENLNITEVNVNNGDTLQFTVESLASEPTDLIMTMAATTYGSYFSKGEWITRDGDVSLSLTHKEYILSGTANDKIIKLVDSWNKVVDRHSVNSNWSNASGLHDQYSCHYNTIGRNKNPWNIEPSRPDKSYAATVYEGCNPEW